MKIKVLPPSVTNHISAGEVIDRPASVVRELVDNSIDAGATEISVYLEEGGQSLIRVQDNGEGMEKDDALIAFERHATSKLETPEDLFRIRTLGFRGEALPSIAAISKIILRTRRSGDSVGTEISLQAGIHGGTKSISMNPGTELEISGLFFNTPARKKFMKSTKTEEQKVKQWLLDVALAYPKIKFRLSFDGKEVFLLAPKETLQDRAKTLIKGSTVSVSRLTEKLAVEGVLAHPAQAQSQAQALVVIVNRRVVSDRMIARAVKDGFGFTLKDREYPLGVLHIEIDPQEVDVNVHPQKSEVRFRSGQGVFSFVRTAVVDAIKEFKGPARSHQESSFKSTAVEPKAPLATSEQKTFNFFQSKEPAENKSQHIPLPGESDFRFSELKYIGQAFECYLLCERNGELVVVDMHAAHERHRFNLIRNAFVMALEKKSRCLPSQKLLFSESIKIPTDAYENLKEDLHYLECVGFEIEEEGNEILKINAMPSLFGTVNPKRILQEVFALGSAQGAVERRLEALAARLACHGSIRSGKILTKEEVYALFEVLDSDECSAACPHGRPVVVGFTEAQVEKWFGRDR